MESEFVRFLLAELEKRGWRKAEFARRAGLSPATVTRVVSGENSPGEDFVLGTAKALDLPAERVMRLAGILPDLGEMMPEAREWSARLMAVPPDRRAAARQAIEYVIQLAENEPGGPAREGPRRHRRGVERDPAADAAAPKSSDA